MNAQRYTPEELDAIADQLRDEAIRLATVEMPARQRSAVDDFRFAGVAGGIHVRVSLAQLLRDDAARLRRNAAMMQKRD